MKLLWSKRSPFARKVMIVVAEKGLANNVQTINTIVMMAAPANKDVLKYNPLCKIPVLILADGNSLFDSRVICEYLDEIGKGPNLIPSQFDQRIKCMCLQSLSDGLLDILLLWRTEVGRGELCNDQISNSFDTKVKATMAQLEKEVVDFKTQPLNLGHISVVCVLAQLNFRYPNCNWQKAHPTLSAWYNGISRLCSVLATAVEDDDSNMMGNVDMPLRFK
ncbi:MAG: glutathione S-transferase [Hyphomicrobiales bacterium]|nr:MAG: glutathione S-transferase [Hyphomicrobiales bacterium]